MEMRFSNNKELYDYLVALSAELLGAGSRELAEVVTTASRAARAIPATEFLGESRIALRRVLAEENGILSKEKHSELLDALAQLDSALDRR
jgi:hypothetical protein